MEAFFMRFKFLPFSLSYYIAKTNEPYYGSKQLKPTISIYYYQ